MTKVNLYCVYAYDSNSQEKTEEYTSPNVIDNLMDPRKMMTILTKEIKESTGREVKSFIMFGKDPYEEEKNIKIVGEITS